jgi:hypothetical protein
MRGLHAARMMLPCGEQLELVFTEPSKLISTLDRAEVIICQRLREPERSPNIGFVRLLSHGPFLLVRRLREPCDHCREPAGRHPGVEGRRIGYATGAGRGESFNSAVGGF